MSSSDITRTPPIPQPWDRLPAETHDEFARFWEWLHSEPRDPNAEGSAGLTPTWRERAHAWDLQYTMWTSTGGVLGAKERAMAILMGTAQICHQETMKDARRSALGERIGTLKDRIAFLALLQNSGLAAALAPSSSDDDIDWEAVTAEERELLMRALPVLERRRKK